MFFIFILCGGVGASDSVVRVGRVLGALVVAARGAPHSVRGGAARTAHRACARVHPRPSVRRSRICRYTHTLKHTD